MAIERIPRRDSAFQLPRAISRDGRFEVDATWGTVQPVELAPGVRTVGELEVIEHLERGLPVIDTRLPKHRAHGTIPGAKHISHEDILDRIGELDGRPTIFFCNGPQCKATPDAVDKLLRARRPPAQILYYRGGIHDWVTLGFPLSAR